MNIPVPAWATHFILWGNSIDGWPPVGFEEYDSLPALTAAVEFFRRQAGGGEWDVLVYACETKRFRQRAPYGTCNRYRKLGSLPGSRVELITDWTYCNPLSSRAAARAFWKGKAKRIREPKSIRFVRGQKP